MTSPTKLDLYYFKLTKNLRKSSKENKVTRVLKLLVSLEGSHPFLKNSTSEYKQILYQVVEFVQIIMKAQWVSTFF